MKYQKINDTKYYGLDTIIENYGNFKKGCKSNNKILEKHELTNQNYLYARYTNDEWQESDGSSKKVDKIFISKEWFDKKYTRDKKEIIDNTEIAPDIIKLKENEKFYDDNGNSVDIEVRGERHVDKCFFKVNDVSKGSIYQDYIM